MNFFGGSWGLSILKFERKSGKDFFPKTAEEALLIPIDKRD